MELFEANVADPSFDYSGAGQVDQGLEAVCLEWACSQFSLASLPRVGPPIYEMYRESPSNFALVPFHLVFYCLRGMQAGSTLAQIEEEVGAALGEMSKKYPPSSASSQVTGPTTLQSY